MSEYELVVPPGRIIVLGDDRQAGYDSRAHSHLTTAGIHGSIRPGSVPRGTGKPARRDTGQAAAGALHTNGDTDKPGKAR